MPYAPILATLGYIFSPDKKRVLMVHRIAKPGDYHTGKYNGLGGKLEPGEDVVAGMKREIREEAGIEVTKLELVGTISWPGFGKKGEDWFAFLFRIYEWDGEIATASEEGPLEWIDISEVEKLTLWDGDRLFLPYVFDLQNKGFHGVMPYLNGKPTSWNVTFLSN
jgi:8-oxo-dGTP diphosphatase